MKTGNLIINWVSLSSSNIPCLLTKYEINKASNFLVNQERYGSVTSQNLFVNWEELGSASLSSTLRKSQF